MVRTRWRWSPQQPWTGSRKTINIITLHSTHIKQRNNQFKKSSSSRSFTTLPWLLASSTLAVQVLLLLITMTLPWSPAISWGPTPDQIKSSQFDAVMYRISQKENRRPLDCNKEQTKLRNYNKEKVTILSHLRNCPSTNWDMPTRRLCHGAILTNTILH